MTDLSSVKDELFPIVRIKKNSSHSIMINIDRNGMFGVVVVPIPIYWATNVVDDSFGPIRIIEPRSITDSIRNPTQPNSFIK
jgi:hypothetical protein